MKTTFTMIRQFNSVGLCERVNKLLDKGWKLHGSSQVVFNGGITTDDKRFIFFQAMTLDDPNN